MVEQASLGTAPLMDDSLMRSPGSYLLRSWVTVSLSTVMALIMLSFFCREWEIHLLTDFGLGCGFGFYMCVTGLTVKCGGVKYGKSRVSVQY